MSYRDDLDAAQSRAAALEAKLERAEAERDRAASERDHLAEELAEARAGEPEQRAREPSRHIVVARNAPLTLNEREELIQTLATAGQRRQGSAKVAYVVSAILVAGMIVATAVDALFWAFLLGGIGYWAVSLMRLGLTSAHRWQPVLAAIRDDPSKILRVVRDGRSLVIMTRRGTLAVPRDQNTWWLLARHCPDAIFEE